MTHPNMGNLVAAAWESVLRETPDPFREGNRMLYFDGCGRHSRPSYRHELDRIRVNCYGELIPRIVTVRHNLRLLGNIRLDPRRLQ